MNALRKTALALGVALPAHPAWAQITFYEGDNYRGRAFTATRAVSNFTSVGFNDRASSVVVKSGRWKVWDDADFSGSCVLLRPGSYASLSGMGLNARLSSVRKVGQRRDALVEARPRRRAALCLSASVRGALVRGAGHLGARRRWCAHRALLGRAPASGART